MHKNTNMNNNSAVALITAHGWVGVSTPVVMTAKYLASKGYLVDIYMTENELCNNLGIATPDITSKNIKIYKNKTQNSHQIITTSSGLKIYTTDLEFAAKYSSPPKKYGWIIGFDPAGLIRAALLASAWNVPFIYHSLELCNQEDPYKEIERIFSQKALFTLIQDNVRADILAQTNGLDRDKIEIIYNSSLGDASSEKSDFLRDTFKIQKDKKIVLATGTLLPITCIDQIIKSVGSWPGNFVLVLHGWIPDKNFELKVLKEIETKKDKIFLSTEILGVEEKHKVFQSADIGLAFYNPIDTNLKFAAGSSGKIFDFMKAGVPIIGNNIPGMSELLVGDGCGMVVNNASEIGNVLHNLMDQYEVLKKGCMENFPKYEFGRCYEKLLNRVISEIQRSQHMKKDSQAMLPLNNTASQNRLQSMDENILRNTDILVASYPRSGNTWVRNLLADIVLQIHGINTDTHRWEDTDRIVPDIHQKQLNNIDERLKLPYRLIKTHDVFNPLVQKTIYIFREASDSLCSYYHFLKDISNKKDLEDIDSFCINTLGEWYKHVHSYVNAYKLKGAKILFVSYELLHEDPITALLSITEFLDLEVNKKMCERAVRNQEFQKHKNQSVVFYRKGIIGSSREELKETTLKYIKEKALPLYEETKKLIHLSRFEQELEREFYNLRKTNSPKPDERFDSFVKRTINISTQAIKENQFEVALRLIVMAKYFKMPVYGLDYTRALSFLGMGQKESVVEALKEELRYFPQNSEAELLLKDIIKTSHTTEPTKYNSEFQELLDTVRPYTMVGEERLLALYQLAKKVCEMDIPGNFVECGVAGGGSSVLLAMVLKRYSKRKRILFSLDSFDGMPATTEEDIHGGIAADSTGWGTGTCAAPEECVRELFRKLGVLDVVKTVKGYFKDTLPTTRNEISHIAFLHMDGDWYESTRDILSNIYDLVDGNGFIQVDDYGYWEGCRKAIHEFEKNKGIHFNIQKIDGTGVWFQRPSEGISNVKQDKRLKLLNLGCGSHYKEGWVNVDFNSTGPGVIAYNLNCGIPFENASLDVVYHSHLLEHFSKNSAQRFISECHRILKDGGIIRVVVPDLEKIIKWYSTLLEKSLNGDQEAQKRYEWIMLELFDQMVRRVSGGEMLKYWKQNPMPAESFVIERCGSEVLNAINHLRSNSNLSQSGDHVASESALTKEQVGQFVLSGQNHQWMYDRYSLSKLLREAGFDEIRICSADESRIPDFNSYFMDIEPDGSVRKPDSLFVEAIKKEKLVIAEEKKEIKIVHLCMQDFGGAGGAAYRLHRGLLSIGVNSTMVVLNKKSEDPSVKVIPDNYPSSLTPCVDIPRHDSQIWLKQAKRWDALMGYYPKRPAGLEVFTDADSDARLDLVKEIQEADIINLHWVAGMLDSRRVPLALGQKPVVWTIHDMNPFTGGCHYSGDCVNYRKSCGNCPQLGSDQKKDLSNIIWKKKEDAYRSLNINIISPSRWLGRCASESKLFSRLPISVIPNGFPIDIFKPYPKKEIREALNITESANVILFGADSVVNKRKGFIYLLEALANLTNNDNRDILITTFGRVPDNVKISSKYPVKNLGPISDQKQLAMIYSMANLFVIPSLEDNLPNTVVESMACGTPVVGFNIGGIPDMIEHKETGYLVKPKDIDDLTKGINWVISSSEETKLNLSKQCRKKAVDLYALEIQANNYRKLYEELYERHQSLMEEASELNTQAKQALQNDDIQSAKELLTKVLHQSPNNIKALNNLAVTKIIEKDWDFARNTLQKVLKLDTSNKVALENTQYLETQMSLHNLLLEAEKLIEQKEYQKARKILENILETDERHVDALNNLAVLHITESDFSKALELLNIILKIHPENEIARGNYEYINKQLEQMNTFVTKSEKDRTSPEHGAGKDIQVNKQYLNYQRNFWNTETIESAMFDKVFVPSNATELSPEDRMIAWNASVHNSTKKILQGIPINKDWKVLEIGCGVGRLIKPLREMFSQVDGVDIAENMVNFARKYLADGKQNGHISVNSGSDLKELSDQTYNFVFSMIVFQHIRSASVVNSYFQEIKRVLKPGGFFRLQVYDTSDPKIGHFNEEATPGNVYGMTGNGYTPEQLRALLDAHGYDVLDIEWTSPWIWATAQKPSSVDSLPENNLTGVSFLSKPPGEKALISAIVSTYNSEQFIQGCLEDLEEQTIADKLEIIVVDSGSEQNEREIVEKFQQKHDNIKYIRTKRKSLYAAWNRGIREATGKYITNANTDDRHRADALEIQSGILDENTDIHLVYGDCYMSLLPNETFEQNSKNRIYKYPDYFPPSALLQYQFGPQPMWKKTIHDTMGLFDDNYSVIGDFDFNIRFALHFNALHIREPIGLYLKTESALSFKDNTAAKEMERINKTYRTTEIIRNLYHRTGTQCNSNEDIAKILLDMGTRALEYYPGWQEGNAESNPVFAIQCLRQSMELDPKCAAAYNNLAVALCVHGSQNIAEKLLQAVSQTLSDVTIHHNLKLISEAIAKNKAAQHLLLSPSGMDLPTEKALAAGEKTNLVRTYLNQQPYKQLVARPQKDYRVLFVAHNFLPHSYAGVELYTYNLAKSLIEMGISVSVFYPIINPAMPLHTILSDSYKGISIYKMVVDGTSILEISHTEKERSFKQFLDNYRFAVVHFQHTHRNIPISFIQIPKKLGIPVILTLHDFWLICIQTHLYIPETHKVCVGPDTVEKCLHCICSSVKNTLNEKQKESLFQHIVHRQEYVKELMHEVDVISAPSRFVADKFSSYGFEKNKIVVSPLGIKSLKTTPKKKKPDSLTFGYIGTIWEIKNVFLLVETFALTKGDAALVIYGDGSPESINHLINIINSPKITYGGRYLPEQLPQIFSAVDVIIVPSLIESYCFTVREALIAGVPVIAANVGGIPEVVRHMENGILFDPTNKEELLKSIQLIIENPSIIDKLKKDMFSPKTIEKDAKEWAICYENILAKKTNYVNFQKEVNIAEVLFQKGAYAEAIDAYKKAIETSPSPNQQLPPEETSRLCDAYYNLALSYVNTQNLDDAIATFQKAVELHNADATIYNNLGVLYFRKKMHDDARRCFEKALAIDANYAEAKQNLEKISSLKNS